MKVGALLLLLLAAAGGTKLFEYFDQEQRRQLLVAGGVLVGATLVSFLIWFFARLLIGLQLDSQEYAENISSRGSGHVSLEVNLWPIKFRATSRRTRRPADRLPNGNATGEATLPQPPDLSDPDKLFQAARQRLLDEAVRTDSIARRNLMIGIMFSVIALGVLAWPLVSQAFLPTQSANGGNILTWVAQYYLPRFAVGLLLQLVGFFFLRLYVSNELDLKHNKNEITNLEI